MKREREYVYLILALDAKGQLELRCAETGRPVAFQRRVEASQDYTGRPADDALQVVTLTVVTDQRMVGAAVSRQRTARVAYENTVRRREVRRALLLLSLNGIARLRGFWKAAATKLQRKPKHSPHEQTWKHPKSGAGAGRAPRNRARFAP